MVLCARCTLYILLTCIERNIPFYDDYDDDDDNDAQFRHCDLMRFRIASFAKSAQLVEYCIV